MTTTYLGLATVPTNSTNPSVPVNNAMAAFDAAIAGTATRNLVADANYTLLPADYLTSLLIITDTGPVLTVGRDIVFPAGFPRMYVTNSTAKTLTLKKAGQTGIALAAGATSMVYSGATDVQQPASGAVSSVNGASGAVVLTIASLTVTQTVTSSATVTPVATQDKVVISAQASALTIANPSGTAAEGQGFVIALKDSGTARAITFGTNYRPMGAALPTTTIAGKWMYIPVMYNATDSKWDVFAVSQQA
jgi:hypothetical protein